MTTLRFTENQIVECGYDFSELPEHVPVDRIVTRRTYWDNESDQLITVLRIVRRE